MLDLRVTAAPRGDRADQDIAAYRARRGTAHRHRPCHAVAGRYRVTGAGGIWLFGGDSITQGARHTHGARGYVQLFEEELRYRRRRHAELVVNAAVDGSTVESGGPALGDWFERLRPARVCLMFGTNDAGVADPAAFEHALAALVRRARVGGALVAVATPPPVRGGWTDPRRARLPEFVSAVRSVAASGAAVLVDHSAAWRAADLDALLDDDIHPNARGHELLAETLLAALDPWLVRP
jgi:lysophospholipase L1-like esterase